MSCINGQGRLNNKQNVLRDKSNRETAGKHKCLERSLNSFSCSITTDSQSRLCWNRVLTAYLQSSELNRTFQISNFTKGHKK